MDMAAFKHWADDLVPQQHVENIDPALSQVTRSLFTTKAAPAEKADDEGRLNKFLSSFVANFISSAKAVVADQVKQHCYKHAESLRQEQDEFAEAKALAEALIEVETSSKSTMPKQQQDKDGGKGDSKHAITGLKASYAELKSLAACPDSNAACDFSGVAIIVRCEGKTLDANLEKRFFYGRGSGSSLRVRGCVLKKGKASGSAEIDKDGGAIHVDSGCSLELQDVTFSANTCDDDGGAIYASTGVDLKIFTSSFVSNKATGSEAVGECSGGAISADGIDGAVTITISDTKFESNTASLQFRGLLRTVHAHTQGGAIYTITKGIVTKIVTSTFSGNKATDGGNDIFNSAMMYIYQSDFLTPAGDINARFYCLRGRSLNRTSQSCTLCPKGRFNPNGYINTSDPDNLEACASCSKCPAGRYGTKEAGADVTDGCKECPAGEYQNSP
eukprot:g1471.t1